ncbi:MAG: acyl carrier protein [Spirochaetia bacterium]|nr:acyl carrier protein [Spirochaetia bacterium]
MTRDEVFNEIKKILVDTFEIEESSIVGSSNVYQDLDLDSIDAIDLIIKLQEITGKKVEPEEFKNVRTIDDVVDIAHKIIQQK